MAELNRDDIQAVRNSVQKMIDTVKDLPEETIRWKPSEDEWSIMQIAAHTAEALPYWAKQIENIIENPEAKWGRDHTDEARLQKVSEENINKLTVDELLSELQEVPAAVEAALGKLTEEQRQIVAPSNNPNFEGKPVQFIIDKLIVGHVEGHYGQMQRNLSKR